MRRSAYTMYENGEVDDAPPPEYDGPPDYDSPAAGRRPQEYNAGTHQRLPRGSDPQAPSAYTVSETQTAPVKKASRAGLFLRVSGQQAEDCVKAKKMCSIFEGGLPLVLYYTDEARYDFQSGIRTDNDPDLVKGLKKLLGEKNVVVKV